MNLTKQQQFENVALSLELIADRPKCEDQSARHKLLNSCANVMRDAAQGHARYEALRCLNPREYAELWSRALLGERFDDMVDDLVKAKNES